jgi:oxygen-independent coproporphyrinogen-3 oxidase
MGFSASATQALIGLGVSAIGDNRLAYAQNEKNLQQYESRVLAGNLPLQRGHILSADDLRVRDLLWKLLGASRAPLSSEELGSQWWPSTRASLQALQRDALITIDDTLVVTELGRAFLRQIGMAFDQHLRRTG